MILIIIKLLFVFFILAVIADISINYKKNKFQRFNTREIIKKENFFNRKIRAFIKKYPLINDYKEKYTNKLCLINGKEKEENESIIENFLLLNIIISLLSGFVFFELFPFWLMILSGMILCMFFIFYIGIFYVTSKINRIYSNFPLALQLFTSEYVSSENIKSALKNSYSKMPGKISKAFEFLTRSIGKDYKNSLKDFAKGLDYTLAYAFSELLLLSFEGANDIKEHLLYLYNLASDEIKDSLESESKVIDMKLTFIIVNICTLIVMVFCMAIIPIAKHLYFYTPTGNLIIIAWISNIVLGFMAIEIFKRV